MAYGWTQAKIMQNKNKSVLSTGLGIFVRAYAENPIQKSLPNDAPKTFLAYLAFLAVVPNGDSLRPHNRELFRAPQGCAKFAQNMRKIGRLFRHSMVTMDDFGRLRKVLWIKEIEAIICKINIS